MFCENCGSPLPEDSKFCLSCGAKVAGTGPVQEAAAAAEAVQIDEAPAADAVVRTEQQESPAEPVKYEPQPKPVEPAVQPSQAQPVPQTGPDFHSQPQPAPQFEPNRYTQPQSAPQTQTYQQPAGPVSQPAAVKTEKPLPVWKFIGMMLLSAIPVIGFIMILVWSFGSSWNKNTRNYARAVLILGIIGFILTIVGIIINFETIRTLMEFFNSNYEIEFFG
jgi:hypothetical protein